MNCMYSVNTYAMKAHFLKPVTQVILTPSLPQSSDIQDRRCLRNTM